MSTVAHGLRGANNTVTQITEDFVGDKMEVLRQILVSQQHREVSYDEAREIGDTLVDFYRILAEEDVNDSAN